LDNQSDKNWHYDCLKALYDFYKNEDNIADQIKKMHTETRYSKAMIKKAEDVIEQINT
jgi:hypothetical protein